VRSGLPHKSHGMMEYRDITLLSCDSHMMLDYGVYLYCASLLVVVQLCMHHWVEVHVVLMEGTWGSLE